MKKIEINGLGVLVEVYKRKDTLSDIEAMKEAAKALQREVIKRESNIDKRISREHDSNEL